MADFLDVDFSSPPEFELLLSAKSPAPLEITPDTTLDDVIAATILNVKSDSDVKCDKLDSDSDIEDILDDIAAGAPPRDDDIITRPSVPSDFDVPVSDSRLSGSLFDLLGSPQTECPLSRSSFLLDLQTVLMDECKKYVTPKTLISTVVPQKSSDSSLRQRQIQNRFQKLQCVYPAQTRELSSFYNYQSSLIETERYRELHEQSQQSPSLQASINSYYDDQLHLIMDRVEVSISMLEQTVQIKCDNSTSEHSVNSRPTITPRAIRLMEQWYECHRDYPYPTKCVVQNISKAVNITEEQVKKWFANKRSRSKNTRSLSEIAKRKRLHKKMPQMTYLPYM